MRSRKIPELLANILKRAGSGIEDLDVASKVSVSVDFSELVKMLVGDSRNVELMVSNCQEIVIGIFEDRIADQTIWIRRVAQPGAIVQVLMRINIVL